MVLTMTMAAGCVICSPAPAQEPDPGSLGSIEGKWAGAVALPGEEFRFSVTFEQAEGVLSATMDIPAQGAMGLPLTAVSYVDGRVHFEFDGEIRGLAVWDGAHVGDTIEGEFKQGDLTATFSVSRADAGPPEAEEAVLRGFEEVPSESGVIHLVLEKIRVLLDRPPRVRTPASCDPSAGSTADALASSSPRPANPREHDPAIRRTLR